MGTSLTYTQIMRNKELFAQAKARAAQITATVIAKRPKWRFEVLAVVEASQGTKVEVFDDYTFANKWTQSLGGGVVYPRHLVLDYTSTSVTLNEGLAVASPEAPVDEHGQLGMRL